MPPDDTPRGYALSAHCFTCGKDVFAAARIAQQLKVVQRTGQTVRRLD